MDAGISNLVQHDVVVSKELANVASDILDELDSTLGDLKTELKFPSKASIKKHRLADPELIELPFDDAIDDDSSVESVEPLRHNTCSMSMENLTSKIRQQCADITEATYQATSAEACAQLSRTLDDALQTFNSSIARNTHKDVTSYSNAIQEEIVYAQFY